MSRSAPKPLPKADFLRPHSETVLADDWATLTKYKFDYRRRDGTWQRQVRQSYDRGNGAVALLHNPDTDCVLLTRQFRLPVFLNVGLPGLIEAPAGLLDGAAPLERMRAELAEETGFRIDKLTHLYDVHTSPGSVSEYLAYFIGTYAEQDRVSEGGGEVDEGEDIEVLHIPLAEAVAMIGKGEMCDAKTIILVQHLWIERCTQST